MAFTSKVIDDLYTSKNVSAMKHLKKMLALKGTASLNIAETSDLGGEQIPSLYFGAYKSNEDFSIIDQLQSIVSASKKG